MLCEIKPSKKTSYAGVRVNETGLRITKDLREKLGTNKISIKRDTEMLQIALYAGGSHNVDKDGRVNLAKKRLQLPNGRYVFKRRDGMGFVCELSK